MPPPFGALNPNDHVVKRDTNPQDQDNPPPSNLLLSPGPLIGCIIAAREWFRTSQYPINNLLFPLIFSICTGFTIPTIPVVSAPNKASNPTPKRKGTC